MRETTPGSRKDDTAVAGCAHVCARALVLRRPSRMHARGLRCRHGAPLPCARRHPAAAMERPELRFRPELRTSASFVFRAHELAMAGALTASTMHGRRGCSRRFLAFLVVSACVYAHFFNTHQLPRTRRSRPLEFLSNSCLTCHQPHNTRPPRDVRTP
jgi:hypothetical protein